MASFMSPSSFVSFSRSAFGGFAPAYFFFSSCAAAYSVLTATGGRARAEPKNTIVSRTSRRWNRCRGSRYSHIIRMMRASRLLRNCGLRYAFWAFLGGTKSEPPFSFEESTIQFLQIREGRLDQGADRLFAEIELEARRPEQ